MSPPRHFHFWFDTYVGICSSQHGKHVVDLSCKARTSSRARAHIKRNQIKSNQIKSKRNVLHCIAPQPGLKAWTTDDATQRCQTHDADANGSELPSRFFFAFLALTTTPCYIQLWASPLRSRKSLPQSIKYKNKKTKENYQPGSFTSPMRFRCCGVREPRFTKGGGGWGRGGGKGNRNAAAGISSGTRSIPC